MDSAIAKVEDIQSKLFEIASAVSGRVSGNPVAAGNQLKELQKSVTKGNIIGDEELTVQAGAYIYGLNQRINTMASMMTSDPERFSNRKWAEGILEISDKEAAILLDELKRSSRMTAEVGTPALLESLKDLSKMVSGGAIYPDEIESKVIPVFELLANDEETPVGIRNLLNKAIESLNALFPNFGSAAGSSGDRVIEKLWRDVQDKIEEAILRLNKGGVKTKLY